MTEHSVPVDAASASLPRARPTSFAPLSRARRSTKSFASDPLTSESMAGLVNEALIPDGSAYASAHRRYLVRSTVVVGNVSGLAPGAYAVHEGPDVLELIRSGEHRSALGAATLDAPWIADCPAVVVLSADLAAAEAAFQTQGVGRGTRFAWIEAGLITQNVYLWAAATGHGAVLIGGIDDDAMVQASAPFLPSMQSTLGLLPIGISL